MSEPKRHPLEWEGSCSKCGVRFRATGAFAVDFKRPDAKPLCADCQGIKRIKRDTNFA